MRTIKNLYSRLNIFILNQIKTVERFNYEENEGFLSEITIK